MRYLPPQLLHMLFFIPIFFLSDKLEKYLNLILFQDLKKLDISFHMLLGDPSKTLPIFIKSCNIGGIVADFCPLKEVTQWLDDVVKTMPKGVPVLQVLLIILVK